MAPAARQPIEERMRCVKLGVVVGEWAQSGEGGGMGWARAGGAVLADRLGTGGAHAGARHQRLQRLPRPQEVDRVLHRLWALLCVPSV